MLDNKGHAELKLICDLENYIDGYRVIDIRLSTKNRILVLCIYKDLKDKVDYSSNVNTKNSSNYKIIEIGQESIKEIELEKQTYDYSFIQNINYDNYLLVGSRCCYYSDEKKDLNAKIVNNKGETISEFVLGDGIEDVYVSESNVIWTSYFDEGVYGNYGWENPMGTNGLVAFNNNGDILYEYDGKGWIDDCYVLNVSNDNEAWIYYYSDFEISRIKENKDVEQFNPKLSGADGIAISSNFLLLKKSCDSREEYYLYKRTEGSDISFFKKINIRIDKHSERLMFSNRDSKIVYLLNGKVYIFDLNDILK